MPTPSSGTRGALGVMSLLHPHSSPDPAAQRGPPPRPGLSWKQARPVGGGPRSGPLVCGGSGRGVAGRAGVGWVGSSRDAAAGDAVLPAETFVLVHMWWGRPLRAALGFLGRPQTFLGRLFSRACLRAWGRGGAGISGSCTAVDTVARCWCREVCGSLGPAPRPPGVSAGGMGWRPKAGRRGEGTA